MESRALNQPRPETALQPATCSPPCAREVHPFQQNYCARNDSVFSALKSANGGPRPELLDIHSAWPLCSLGNEEDAVRNLTLDTRRPPGRGAVA